MTPQRPLNFGVFLTPFHPVGQSPPSRWSTTWTAPSRWTGSASTRSGSVSTTPVATN